MFDVPQSLSPSRVEAFLSCPLAFRFASLEKLPEPPSPHTTKGSLVHRTLEILFTHPSAQRTESTAAVAHQQAVAEYRVHPDFTLLGLTDAQATTFFDDCWALVKAYFAMEDPTAVRDIGLELRLEAQVGDLALRGIIDRLELDHEGRLVVTDYKTGRSPGPQHQQSRLAGVHFYSFLCSEVLGHRPASVRLMYLRSGDVITATPTEQSVRFLTTRTTAVWKAVEKACSTGDFRPKPGPLCGSCAFKPWCPSFGGQPELARLEAPVRYGAAPAA
jgi:putative RecB family exonuclease